MSSSLPEPSVSTSVDGALRPDAGALQTGGSTRLDSSAKSGRQRAELLIAVGRAVLIVFSLMAAWLDPLPASQTGAQEVLIMYGVFALGVLALSVNRTVVPHRGRVLMHGIDLLFITVLLVVTQGATSFFFPFFIFVLLSGTLRFGSRGTILTATATVSVFIAASLVTELSGEAFELNRFLIRVSHLVVLAVLLVYLARHDERTQRDIAGLANWKFEDADELRSLLQSTLFQVASTMRTDRNVILIEPNEEPWTHIAIQQGGSLRLERVGPDRYPEAVNPRLAGIDFICDESTSDSATITATGESPLRSWSGRALGQEFGRDFGGGPLVSVGLQGRTFTGRLFCFAAEEQTLDDLLLAGIVGTFVRSRLDEFYLLRAAEAAAVEQDRHRLARDLHDGLLQSLTAVRLQLQSLDNHLDDPGRLRTVLDDVRHIIEADHHELRRFVQNLRPSGAAESSTRLDRKLADLCERIKRQWGIEVAFDVAPETNALEGDLLHDIYSVIHEAVANTARHASPSVIRVRVEFDKTSVTILVSNDGRGFPFQGRYTLEELQRLARGPVSLKERIALLEGEMILDSREDGSELFMRLPVRRKPR